MASAPRPDPAPPAIALDVSPERALIAIGWMALTGLCFVAVTGIVRWLGPAVPAPEAAFLRYLFGFVMLLPFLGRLLAVPRSARQWAVHLLRGLAHAGAVMLWFYAMARIPIAEVTAIGYTAPIYTAVGAALFLGERMAARRMAAIAVAFIGALIIIRPGFRELSTGHLAQVASAPLFATSYLIAKLLTRDESPQVIVGMLTLTVTVALAPPALAVWQPPRLADLAALAAVAAFATLGHYTMTRALEAAPVAVTQPVTFLQLVWATLLGIIAFGEPADPWVLLGGAIIIAAVSYVSWREAVLRRRATTVPPPAMKL